MKILMTVILCSCFLAACSSAGSTSQSADTHQNVLEEIQTEENQTTDSGITVDQGEELSEESMFSVLDNPESLWDGDSNSAKTVYADFVIKDLRENVEPIHGDITIFITAESKFGKEYVLRMDPIRTQFEFEIGSEYTIFISYFNKNTIIIGASLK